MILRGVYVFACLSMCVCRVGVVLFECVVVSLCVCVFVCVV